MLNYNEIKTKKYIVMDGDPWEVVDYQVSRKQANKPVNKTKLKNLITGQTLEHTFHVSDKVNEADVESKQITYQYTNPKNGEMIFSDPNNPKDRFPVDSDIAGDQIKFIPERTELKGLVFTTKDGEEKIIGIKYPVKINLEVAEAPPNIKGNTASGGGKPVTLETGVVITAPFFIEAGDIIEVNTEKSEYVSRVDKK